MMTRTTTFSPKATPRPEAGYLSTRGKKHSAPPFYAVSTNLVFFSASIDLLGTIETRFFRWEAGALAHLSKPVRVLYDLARTDGAGKFLASRSIHDMSREY